MPRASSPAKSIRLIALGTVALLSIVPQAHALDDIVVTAQRRPESAQLVPMAISVFTARDMERRQILRTGDVAFHVPNLLGGYVAQPTKDITYSWRGLINVETGTAFDAPFTTFVDDVPLAGQLSNDFRFFDVERIEVLRGPQGTLRGRNTTAGAINVVLKKPAEAFGGYGEVGFGTFDDITARASVDAPLGAKVRTKLSGYYQRDDGYVPNQFATGPVDDERRQGARVATHIAISDSFTWDLAAAYQRAETSQRTAPVNTPPFSPALFKGKKGTLDRVANDVRSLSATSHIAANLSDNHTLILISGYRTQSQRALTAPPVVRGLSYTARDSDEDHVSQEVVLNSSWWDGKLTAVAGLSYNGERNTIDTGSLSASSVVFFFFVTRADSTVRYRSNVGTVFAQGDLALTPRLTVTLGARYSDESERIAETPNTNLPPPLPLGLVNGRFISSFTDAARTIPETRQSVQHLAPRVAASYRIGDDILVYASATRAYTSGAINVNAAIPVPNARPEKNWTYETGVKSEWFGGTLRANVNGFLSRTEDLQVRMPFRTPNGGFTSAVINPVGQRTYGGEADVAWEPVENLQLSLALGLQEAEYIDIDPSILARRTLCITAPFGGFNCDEGLVTSPGAIAKPIFVPDVTSTLGLSYALDLPGGLELAPSVFARYVGEYFIDRSRQAPNPFVPLGNLSPYQKAYWLVNARLALSSPDLGWTLAAECTNCGDRTLRFRSGFNQSQRWTVRASYKF